MDAEFGIPRSDCGKAELFHSFHRFIHRGFPHPFSGCYPRWVYITKAGVIRQVPHFFACQKPEAARRLLSKKRLDKGDPGPGRADAEGFRYPLPGKVKKFFKKVLIFLQNHVIM